MVRRFDRPVLSSGSDQVTLAQDAKQSPVQLDSQPLAHPLAHSLVQPELHPRVTQSPTKVGHAPVQTGFESMNNMPWSPQFAEYMSRRGNGSVELTAPFYRPISFEGEVMEVIHRDQPDERPSSPVSPYTAELRERIGEPMGSSYYEPIRNFMDPVSGTNLNLVPSQYTNITDDDIQKAIDEALARRNGGADGDN